MLAAASGARAATARARSWAAAFVAGGLRADASWGRSRAGLGRWFGATAAALADFDGVPPGVKKLLSEYESVPLERTRNFSIIAHVDHGKSTLADRMLELVGNIYKPGEAPGAAPPGSTKAAMAAAKAAESVANEQVLDSLKVERERGITVKAQTASLLYVPSGGDPDKPYLLNLIDTPGHVDFAYEVSRSLAACQGALLLVDCTQGVQAQTVANLSTARKSGLEIIPALTKIDLPNADPEPALEQIESVLRLPTDDVPWTSGKTGDGVTDALDAVVRRLGMPKGRPDAPTRALLFDSWYDEFRGVICVLQVVDGVLEKGDRVQTSHGDSQYVISELGLLTPGRHPVRRILAGQVGYVVTGMRDPREARVGDTVVVVQGAGATPAGEPPVGPLPGFEPSKPMVFASIFPVDTSDFDGLRVAVEKLALTDSSVTLVKENSSSLGFGFRCGFLGLLHMDVFHQRLADEFDMPVIATAPMVPYRIELEAGHSMPAGAAGTEAATPDEDGLITVERPDDFPDPNIIRRTFEPMVKASVIAPSEAYSSIMSLMQTHRGRSDEISYLDDGRVLMKYIMPWQEVVTNFFDKLKSATAGYATFDYEPAGYEASNVVKIDMLLNGAPVDSLSFVAHRSSAEVQGRRVAQRLRAVIRRQQFEVVIQAAFGKKIFARERIPPYRKDVLSRSGKTVGGGDLTRKRKLLEKQKKGKARMRSVGNVQLSQEAFHAVLSRGE
ncbi:hypothetical protein FNF29_01501 [Cafeteria roenbergensis]|uniref:Translation factor GUF1 homolog, mitochondrial n=1 Tax=Cafeteria roenbergensis TaxID=33653 RepID=A0A5A8CT69_CAFRO|nr:hypothetical protein FNF29_01501 [Cafeteria roenbergensis]|eukprot:KAA0155584.1 hypothetical protein FNF29_01501 [Cafeteria roenbergensis]